MKAINRLDEITKLSKFDKYLDQLVDKVSKEIHINYNKKYYTDNFTCIYSSMYDADGGLLMTNLRFTTNRSEFGDDEDMEDEFKFACDLVIDGDKSNVGGMTGELEYDSAIIIDSYFDYIDQNGDNMIHFKS